MRSQEALANGDERGITRGLALPITGGEMPENGKGRAAAQGARASPEQWWILVYVTQLK
jgi:hypothetical protein